MDLAKLKEEIERHLNSCLPSDIKAACCHSLTDSQTSGAEAQYLSTISNPKRANYFQLGRQAARFALAKIDPVLSSTVLAKLDNGQIDWPDAVSGSISHSMDLALAIVANSFKYKALGIDIEHGRQVRPQVLDRIAIESEKDLIASQISDLNQATLLLFSCKEAIYKAINKYSEKKLGFMDAELVQFVKNADDFFELSFDLKQPELRMTVYAFQTQQYTLSVTFLEKSKNI